MSSPRLWGSPSHWVAATAWIVDQNWKRSWHYAWQVRATHLRSSLKLFQNMKCSRIHLHAILWIWQDSECCILVHLHLIVRYLPSLWIPLRIVNFTSLNIVYTICLPWRHSISQIGFLATTSTAMHALKDSGHVFWYQSSMPSRQCKPFSHE